MTPTWDKIEVGSSVWVYGVEGTNLDSEPEEHEVLKVWPSIHAIWFARKEGLSQVDDEQRQDLFCLREDQSDSWSESVFLDQDEAWQLYRANLQTAINDLEQEASELNHKATALRKKLSDAR